MCKAHFTDLADELVLLISQSLVRDFTPTHEDIYDDGPFYKPMFQESVRRNQQRTRARRALLALSATSRRHRHVLHSICVTHIFNTAKVKIETAEQMEHLQNSGLAEDIK